MPLSFDLLDHVLVSPELFVVVENAHFDKVKTLLLDERGSFTQGKVPKVDIVEVAVRTHLCAGTLLVFAEAAVERKTTASHRDSRYVKPLVTESVLIVTLDHKV